MNNILTILILLLIAFAHDSQAQFNAEDELVLSNSEVTDVIQNTIQAIEDEYLHSDKAQRASKELLRAQNKGEFSRPFKFGRLKQKIEATLIKATGDSSFELVRNRPFSSVELTPEKQQVNKVNMQILEGNIGYLGFHGNFVFSDSETDVANAFAYLASAEALIIDMRHAGDGTISLAQQVISYFVDPDTLIGNVHFNPSLGSQRIYSVQHDNTQPRYKQNLPVFILNSSFVAGAWEFLGYTLKHLDKAIIVGEDTMGVATMKKPVPVSKQLSIHIAYARMTHPLANDSWQQQGIFADHQTTAQESFDLAYQLAKREVALSNQPVNDISQ